jgi:hypothetical protein
MCLLTLVALEEENLDALNGMSKETEFPDGKRFTRR